MMECYDEGPLRAYLLDANGLPAAERGALEAHLATCPQCRTRLAALGALDGRVMAGLQTLAPLTAEAPDAPAAWQRMRQRLNSEINAGNDVRVTPDASPRSPADLSTEAPPQPNRRIPVQTFALSRPGPRRAIMAALAAVLVVAALAVPSVRAAADQLLQSFRVQSVVLLPVDVNRLQQLANQHVNLDTLFLSKPAVVGAQPQSRRVSSAEEAAKLVGFTPQEPSALSNFPPTYVVHDQTTMSAQVNLDGIRQVVQLLGLNDVTLPDALGAQPITAHVPAFVQTDYHSNGTYVLVEGSSPTVDLPEGMDLAQLGRAGLRVLGFPADQADAMSKQIDWTSTLVVPFPSNMSGVSRVQVNGAQGLMVNSQAAAAAGVKAPSGNRIALYWQRGDHFYVLVGQGDSVNSQSMLNVAGSVR